MGTRASVCIVACMVLAELAVGCRGPSGGGPGSGVPGAVRPGQTGKLADVPPAEPRGALPSSAPPPLVYLDGGPPPGNIFEYMRIPLVPMVVTENSADEEFWELEYRIAMTTAAGVVDDTVQRMLILGDRQRCEAQGELNKRNAARDARCRGPHYLKRTGPPEPVRPRRAYDL